MHRVYGDEATVIVLDYSCNSPQHGDITATATHSAAWGSLNGQLMLLTMLSGCNFLQLSLCQFQ